MGYWQRNKYDDDRLMDCLELSPLYYVWPPMRVQMFARNSEYSRAGNSSRRVRTAKVAQPYVQGDV